MNKQLDEIKNNAELKAFISENNLSDQQILDQLSVFKRYLDSKKICENCMGLYQCAQKKTGECISLSYQGIVVEEIEYCKYMVKKNDDVRHLSNFTYSDIPDRLNTLDLDNIEYTEDQKELYALLLGILHEKSKRGLYISGDFGVGKTYLCTALANSLAKKGKKVVFIKASSFFSQMKSYLVNNYEQFDKIIKKLKYADCLIIDDLGAESVSQFVREDILFNILEYREENGLLTIFTSNLNIENLFDHFKSDRKQLENKPKVDRLVERIDTMSEKYTLVGRNMRRLKYD